MHKIPVGHITFLEILWLFKLAALTTVGVCAFMIVCILFLAVMKIIFEPLIGEKAIPVVVLLINGLVLLKRYCRRSSRSL